MYKRINCYNETKKERGDYTYSQAWDINFDLTSKKCPIDGCTVDCSERTIKGKVFYVDKKGQRKNHIDLNGACKRNKIVSIRTQRNPLYDRIFGELNRIITRNIDNQAYAIRRRAVRYLQRHGIPNDSDFLNFTTPIFLNLKSLINYSDDHIDEQNMIIIASVISGQDGEIFLYFNDDSKKYRIKLNTGEDGQNIDVNRLRDRLVEDGYIIFITENMYIKSKLSKDFINVSAYKCLIDFNDYN